MLFLPQLLQVASHAGHDVRLCSVLPLKKQHLFFDLEGYVAARGTLSTSVGKSE